MSEAPVMYQKPVTYKTTINLSQDAIDFLRDASDREGTTVADVIRRAIANHKFLRGEVASGKKVLIEDGPGSFRQVVFW